jgi:N-acetylglucosamine-6-phosphate deacetylase
VILGVKSALVDGRLVRGDVEIDDGRIVRVGVQGNGEGRGCAVPGFIDLQVNGFAGVDFVVADADGYERAGEAILATGVCAYQPTFISTPLPELLEAMAEARAARHGPRLIGVHLEGPFLSPRRMGAHPPAARLDPDVGVLNRLLDAGPVSEVTLAPELDGALELIAVAQARGVCVSLGHSDATAEQAHAAFDAGVSTVTHLFNAMRPFRPRDPGIVGAVLARDDVLPQLILDHHHLAEDVARLVWRAARGRVALVTDASAAAGLGNGRFQLGQQQVFAEDGLVQLDDGTLAGSALTMIEAVRHLYALGASFPEAVAAATSVPARILRRSDLGRLQVGSPADVVVLDDALEVRRVLVAGGA